jgi:hypothetical protein
MTRPVLVLVCVWSLLCQRGGGQTTDPQAVDFRWAPASSFAVICLPDDWQKTVVTSDGALGYDFGPGPYARPLTRVSVGVREESLAVSRQYLADPSVPVMTTEFEGKTLRMSQLTFAIIPDPLAPSTAGFADTSYYRVGGLNGCAAWVLPEKSVPGAFRHVAWGTNRPIRFRVKVERGSRKRVALGFCEAYKPRAGTRVLELRVEGAEPLIFDPLAQGGRNEPQVVTLAGEDLDGNGELAIEVHAAPSSPDPNVILNALWVFPETCAVSTAELLVNDDPACAELRVPCGTEMERGAPAPRIDVLRARFEGGEATPVLRVLSRRTLAYDPALRAVRAGETAIVVPRPVPTRVQEVEGGLILELPAGSPSATVYVINGANPGIPSGLLEDPQRALSNVQHFWKAQTRVPRERITVPDSGIQYLLDASVRTIYQVREQVDGRFQLQPGPSVYRGLWVGDLALTAVAALMLGDTAGVKDLVEQVLTFQRPDGQVRVMAPVVSLTETPMLVFALNRLARSTGNRAWLRQHWDAVCRGVEWIRARRQTTLQSPGALYAGLMPPGFVDGGISAPTADYGSVWWALIGLEAAIDGAGRVGDSVRAREWETLYAELIASMRHAARRDLQVDTTGERFLPVAVGGSPETHPQRGQYTFLLALPYGEFFAREDTLTREIIRGNLSLLDARTAEGLVVNAGWLDQGVWPWLGAFHSMAHALYGNRGRATELLYAVANHAAPSGTWVEEQRLKDVGVAVSGDESNAEASGAFIAAVRTMIARERGQDLELLPCVPARWIKPEARVELCDTYGPFGPFSLTLTVDATGENAHLHVSAVDGRGSSGNTVVILEVMREAGFVAPDGSVLPVRIRQPWGRPVDLDFVRRR